MDKQLSTLSVLVDNEAGVLSQVARLFSRKGYNIESFVSGSTADPAITRLTIEVFADDDHAKLLANQLAKLIPVHSVKILTHEDSIRRELVLIKVKAPAGESRSELIQIANIFRASIIDVSIGVLTFAIIGDEDKTQAFINILGEFEILELVCTGIVALERGQETIYDKTKEKGEFDYGKNVL